MPSSISRANSPLLGGAKKRSKTPTLAPPPVLSAIDALYHAFARHAHFRSPSPKTHSAASPPSPCERCCPFLGTIFGIILTAGLSRPRPCAGRGRGHWATPNSSRTAGLLSNANCGTRIEGNGAPGRKVRKRPAGTRGDKCGGSSRMGADARWGRRVAEKRKTKARQIGRALRSGRGKFWGGRCSRFRPGSRGEAAGREGPRCRRLDRTQKSVFGRPLGLAR